MSRVPAVALLLSLAIAPLAAQPPGDPTGHWAGTVPVINVRIELDLEREAGGTVRGTITLPDEQIAGLPMRVTMNGPSLRLQARDDQMIAGTLAADGALITASYQIEGHALPFTLARTGAPHFEADSAHAGLAPGFEGTWAGTIAAPGAAVKALLVLSNRDDGTASGRIVNLDQGRLEIPASGLDSSGDAIALEFKAVGASYRGTLSADGMTLEGTLVERGRSIAMTFRRATAASPR